MTLVLEDGTGTVAGANSYASEAEALAYLTDRGRSVPWSALSSTQRQVALIQASDYLDEAFDFRGTRLLSTQPMDWPRKSLVDDLGVGLVMLPVELKRATIELATRAVAVTTPLLPDIAVGAPGQKVSESVTVGPITESVSYSDSGGGPNSQLPVYNVVKRLLRKFLKGGVGLTTSRVVR